MVREMSGRPATTRDPQEVSAALKEEERALEKLLEQSKAHLNDLLADEHLLTKLREECIASKKSSNNKNSTGNTGDNTT